MPVVKIHVRAAAVSVQNAVISTKKRQTQASPLPRVVIRQNPFKRLFILSI